LFHRLQDLARQDKIQSIQLDFSNSEKLSHVMEALKNAHLPISVFDLSNAWHEAYQIGVEGLKHLVNQVRGQALPNSILLLTNNVYIQSKIGPQYRIGAFGYIGASFEKILPGSKAERKFYDYLRRIETHDNGDYTDLFIHGSLDISKTSVMNPHGRLPDEVVYSGYKFKKNGKAESRSVHRSDCMDSVYSKK